MPNHATAVQSFSQLIEVMSTLLGPNGCPWDREQTHQSIRHSLLEETYECLEAIDDGNAAALREELGDVLLQVVFHSLLAEKTGEFALAEVITELAEKLVRRHPHVFADGTAQTADAVLETWEAIKATEAGKAHRTSLLDGVPKGLPALSRALTLSKKAVKGAGFDWPDVSGIWEKVSEEIAEIKAAAAAYARDPQEKVALAGEIGDLLFTVVNLARHYKIDPEESLEHTNRRFIARFQWMEAKSPRELKDLALDDKETLWQNAKRALDLRAKQAKEGPTDG